jgi:hypothetical protein
MNTIAPAHRTYRAASLPAPPAASLPAPPAYRPGEPGIRIVGALGVAGIAIVHLLDAADTYQGTRYIFWLYMLLVCAAVPVSVALLQWTSSRVWLLAAALAAGPFLGYLASRTVGLPGDSEDIGNWLDTLGLISLFIEASVIALALTRWTALRHH